MARAVWSESHHYSFLELSAFSGAGGGKKPQGHLLSPVMVRFMGLASKENVRHQETPLMC